jgi:site-specific recombinase XerD
VTPHRQRNPTRATTAVTKSATSTTRYSGCSIATPPPPHTATAGKSHCFATELLGNGIPLQDVQDAMGHADPRTTRRYDRSRHNLDRHPTYQMATQLHRTSGPPPV